MIKVRAGLLIVAAVMSFSSVAHAIERRGGTAADYAALEAIAEKWFAAYGVGDAAAVADIYDVDTRIMSEGDVSHTGNAGLRTRLEKAFAEGTTVFTSELEEIEVRSEVAFIVGLYAAKSTKKADQTSKVYGGRFFILLHQTDQGWKVWRDIDNFTPDADPLIAKMQTAPN